MEERVSVINAVINLKPVDMSIRAFAFPAEFTHKTQLIQFDTAEEADNIAIKGSFAKQAKIVKKDGFTRVTVNPMQFNEGIADEVANANMTAIGETKYGDSKGVTSAERKKLKSILGGYGKLKARSDRATKLGMYQILVSGEIVVSAVGAVDDTVDYNLTNKIVNDNSTAGQYQWFDTTNSDPIEQLAIAAMGMGSYRPDAYVLSEQPALAFNAHPKVRTTDNTTTGKKANFIPATEKDAAKSTDKMLYLGKAQGTNGVSLEIYQETEKYNSDTLFYLDKNYVVGFKKGNRANGQTHYGAIPAVEKKGLDSEVESIEGKERLTIDVKDADIASVIRYYKTSPLPTMNQPKAYISIKATLTA